jgi:hypothetical protein
LTNLTTPTPTPTPAPTAADLGIVEDLDVLLANHGGLILVIGPDRDRRSDVVASLVNHMVIAGFRYVICTLSDRARYSYPESKETLVVQRDVATYLDSSWRDGVKNALHMRPHVIAIDGPDSIEYTLDAFMAASQGHLVIASVEADDAETARLELISTFPGTGREWLFDTTVLTTFDTTEGRVPETAESIAAQRLEANLAEAERILAADPGLTYREVMVKKFGTKTPDQLRKMRGLGMGFVAYRMDYVGIATYGDIPEYMFYDLIGFPAYPGDEAYVAKARADLSDLLHYRAVNDLPLREPFSDEHVTAYAELTPAERAAR